MDKLLDIKIMMAPLERYLPVIDGVIRDGFAKLWDYHPEILADFDEAAAAKCIHRHQIMLARQRLDPRPKVNVLNVRGLELVDFHGERCLRFRKVNGAGRGRNIETRQQIAFDRQMPLPGLPDAAIRLVAGYKPTPAGSEIEKVLIACPMGRMTVWTVQIVLAEERKWVDITPLRFAGTYDYRRPHQGGAAQGDARR